MGHTSTEQRWSIINKWKETGSVPDTARELGLLPQVVHWWVQRYEDTGDVKDAPKSPTTGAVPRQLLGSCMRVASPAP